MWSYWIVDTLSGVKQLQVVPSAGSWRRVINGVGSGSHTFQLRDGSLSRDVWRGLTTPWARTLVVQWGDVPVYAGIIMNREYSVAAGTLTVSHSELRVIFSRRLPFRVGGYSSGTLALSGKSFTGAVRAIVRAGAFAESGDQWHLPIAYPVDSAGTFARTWFNYSFETVENLLSDVQTTEGGPDIDFRPRWAAGGTLEWELRVGSPRLSGGTFEWQVSVAQPMVTNVTSTEDAAKQLTGVFSIGAGSEADMRHGEAGRIAGGGIPFLDTSRAHKSADVVADLNSYAMADLVAYREVTEQFGLGVRADASPSAAELVPGSTVRLNFAGDPWLPDGWRPLYLLGLSGDMTNGLTLEVQPA